jgi:CRAL/TRIO domain.
LSLKSFVFFFKPNPLFFQVKSFSFQAKSFVFQVKSFSFQAKSFVFQVKSFVFSSQILCFFQHGASVLVSEIIVVNANSVAEKLVMLVRPFIPAEIYNRIHILPKEKHDKLFDYIPREVVPSDLGGEGRLLFQYHSIGWVEELTV